MKRSVGGGSSDFFRILQQQGGGAALSLLISYCKQQQDYNLLKDIYSEFGHPSETANITVLEAYRSGPSVSAIPHM